MLIDYQSLTNKVAKTSYFFRAPSRFQYHQCYWLVNSYAAFPRHPAAGDTGLLQRSLQGAGACSSWIEYESYCWDSWRNCCGYPMTDPNGAAIYGVPWIPSIYPSHVSIYTIHGSYGYGVFSGRNRWSLPWKTSMLKGKIIEQSGPQQKEDNTVKMGRLIQPSINGG